MNEIKRSLIRGNQVQEESSSKTIHNNDNYNSTIYYIFNFWIFQLQRTKSDAGFG